jgi:hypothetical protein
MLIGVATIACAVRLKIKQGKPAPLHKAHEYSYRSALRIHFGNESASYLKPEAPANLNI